MRKRSQGGKQVHAGRYYKQDDSVK